MKRGNKLYTDAKHAITKNIIEDKIDEFLGDFTVKDLNNLLEELETPKGGNYSYYCDNCGMSMNFASSTSAKLFRRLHSIIGCRFEPVVEKIPPTKTKKERMLVVLRRHEEDTKSMIQNKITEKIKAVRHITEIEKTIDKEEQINEKAA